MTKFFHLLSLFVFILATSCEKSNDEHILEELQEIRTIGNTDPKYAIIRLDSLEEKSYAQTEYVWMKRELLKIRLQDLAYEMPKSDKMILRIIKFFTKHESITELQEAYYAAGCIYRDYQDAPTAIDYYLKSEQIAEKYKSECDSAILRCTYSSLSFLYSHVLNHPSCLEYAKKEYQISLKINKINTTNVMHLADAYSHCDSTEQALKYYDMALKDQLETDKKDIIIISKLLYKYVENKCETKADTCAMLMREIIKEGRAEPFSNSYLSIGNYYRMKENVDSATICYREVLALKENLIDMYNASKALYEIHAEQGDLKEAVKYAKVFVAVNDTLTLGKLQEEAATVNNWYKYMRDKEEEKRIQEENEAYQAKIIKIAVISIIAALVAIVLFLLYRDRQRSKINRQNEIIRSIGQEKENQEKQLHRTQQELQKAKQADAEVREQLTQVNKELKENKKELKIKKDALTLMHRTRTKANAEAYIKELRAKSKRKEMLSSDDWNQLYDAVDGQWPELSELISENVKTKVEDRKKICYMKKAGFSDLQIEFQTGISRSTIIRFLKQNTWMK